MLVALPVHWTQPMRRVGHLIERAGEIGNLFADSDALYEQTPQRTLIDRRPYTG